MESLKIELAKRFLKKEDCRVMQKAFFVSVKPTTNNFGRKVYSVDCVIDNEVFSIELAHIQLNPLIQNWGSDTSKWEKKEFGILAKPSGRKDKDGKDLLSFELVANLGV